MVQTFQNLSLRFAIFSGSHSLSSVFVLNDDRVFFRLRQFVMPNVFFPKKKHKERRNDYRFEFAIATSVCTLFKEPAFLLQYALT